MAQAETDTSDGDQPTEKFQAGNFILFLVKFVWIKKLDKLIVCNLFHKALKLEISYEVIKWMFGLLGHLSVFFLSRLR